MYKVSFYYLLFAFTGSFQHDQRGIRAAAGVEANEHEERCRFVLTRRPRRARAPRRLSSDATNVELLYYCSYFVLFYC